MNKIGLITDDLTGTMTCGVLLASIGLKASSYFSEDNLVGTESQDVIILSAESRNVSSDDAKRRVKKAYRALKSKGAIYFTKRIDTTYRGGIGYEVDAMLEELGKDSIAIMAPTMPGTRRILVGGYSVIDGVALSETAVSKDVLYPVTETHIPTLIRSQSSYQVGEIHLDKVLQGKKTLTEAFINARKKGDRIIVVDSITNEHLNLIAQTINDLNWDILSVDPGAFSQQLALVRGFGSREAIEKVDDSNIDITDFKGKLLLVCGSATDVTRKQVEKLISNGNSEILSINVQRLIGDHIKTREYVNEVVAYGLNQLSNQKKPILIIETAVTSGTYNLLDLEIKNNIKKGEGSKLINNALGEIVSRIMREKDNKIEIEGLYMSGGDTLVSVLSSVGAAGIMLIDTVQPQTNYGKIIGGEFENLNIVGKGGLIGDDETLERVVKR